MNGAWTDTTLGALCDAGGGEVKTGPFGSQLHKSDYIEEGIPVVMPTNLAEGRISTEGIARIGMENVERLSKHKLEPGDIVYGRRGDIGRQALITEREKGWLCGTGCLRISLGKGEVDSKFLHYYLRDEKVISYIANQAVGATMPNLNTKILRSIPVRHPDLPAQRRIAGILSAYDDLIENNLRRIRILEEMAQSLYREWFVHFRFPGHESVPLVDSPLGPIPDGWEVSPLEAVQADQPNAINGGPFGSKLGRKDYVDQGVPVIRGGNLSLDGRFHDSDFVFVSDQKADELRANLAVPGDIVVTQRGTLGQIAMIPRTSRFERFVISQSQMKVTTNPAKVDQYYLFNFLRSPEATGRLINHASSSGVPHINLATLREFLTPLPPRKLQTRFGATAKTAEESIECIQRRIQNLRQTRDLLLPKLLSPS